MAEFEAHLPAGLVLALRFHALGQRTDAQIKDHLHKGGHDLLPLRSGTVDVANQRHVELHVVRGHFRQIVQTATPRPQSRRRPV